jgi:ParB family chromosome partitioning protein
MAASAKKGLGRGLSALIPNADMEFLSRVARGEAEQHRVASPDLASSEATASDEASPSAHDSFREGVQWIAVDDAGPNPYQPRRVFSPVELEELTASIREHGLLQPILVRPMTGDNSGLPYQIVAGERRWRAAKAAGLTKIPAIVREVSDQEALELALIENVQRHDITPLDAALAYKRLQEEFALSQAQVAERVGKNRSTVANTLRLLDLPAEVQTALEDGSLSEGHGRAILLADGEGARRAVFRHVLREKLSVRATEELARKVQQDAGSSDSTTAISTRSRRSKENSVELRSIEELLQKQLQTKVRLKSRRKGGQIIVEWYSNDDLERIIAVVNRH